ncbi:MAG: hypothetical protein ACYCZ7_00810 [Minisyncoccota bacterium]
MDTDNSGVIIFTDGTVSDDLFSKDGAYRALAYALKENLIDDAEQKAIVEQIEGSLLPAKLPVETAQLLAIKEILTDILELVQQEFGGLPQDIFGAKDEATPDDTARAEESFPTPGGKILH